MKKIKLTNSVESILVDNADYKKLLKFSSWRIGSNTIICSIPDSYSKETPYQNTRTIYSVLFDKEIFSTRRVFHLDGNYFNFQRKNLISLDDYSKKRKEVYKKAKTHKWPQSKYRGVQFNFHNTSNNPNKKWKAKTTVTILGPQYTIGLYKTQKEAAIAFDEECYKLFGINYKKFNFPKLITKKYGKQK